MLPPFPPSGSTRCWSQMPAMRFSHWAPGAAIDGNDDEQTGTSMAREKKCLFLASEYGSGRVAKSAARHFSPIKMGVSSDSDLIEEALPATNWSAPWPLLSRLPVLLAEALGAPAAYRELLRQEHEELT